MSTIIKDIYAKDEGFWRWKFFSKEAQKKASTAAARGTRIHALIAGTATGRRVRFTGENRPLRPRLNDYLVDKKPVLVEQGLFSTLGFAGTPDFAYRSLVDGKLYLEDWKSGKIGFDSQKLQLGGYIQLVEEHLNEKLAGARLVQIKNSLVTPDNWVNIEKCRLNFQRIFYIWKDKQTNFD